MVFKKVFFFILIALTLVSFKGNNSDKHAYTHIQNLKEGVLLVRLQTKDVLLSKMKHFGQDVAHKKKKREIYEANKAAYLAFYSAYNFSEIRFFYGRDSKKVLTGDYTNIFINADLKVDASITIPDNVPVYVLDVGNIFFPNMSGHQEGVVVMNSKMEPLTKPFPYYVRKRSGMVIIKRTDLDMAVLLNKNFENFYKESLAIEGLTQ